MRGIGKLAAGAEDYYLNISAGIEDYYVGVSAPGQWIASSQRILGLDGEIDPEGLRTVFAGIDPRTGTQLLRSANRSVMAFDLTFKADKTVSLLHAFAAPEVAAAIEAAHGAAVASSLRYLEDHAVYTRRGHNCTETIRGDGLVAASFRHYRNRNDEPHLHEHVLVPNMVCGDDGRWSTLDARDLYAHAKTAGYIYQAVLRKEMTTNLGILFGTVSNGVAPITGIPRSAVEAFSTRRAEILEHLEAVGATSAKAAQLATLQTRRPKDAEPDLEAIQAEWRTRARVNGLDIDRLDVLIGRAGVFGLSDTERMLSTKRMLSADGLTPHASSFDRRDLIRKVQPRVGRHLAGIYRTAFVARRLTMFTPSRFERNSPRSADGDVVGGFIEVAWRKGLIPLPHGLIHRVWRACPHLSVIAARCPLSACRGEKVTVGFCHGHD